LRQHKQNKSSNRFFDNKQHFSTKSQEQKFPTLIHCCYTNNRTNYRKF